MIVVSAATGAFGRLLIDRLLDRVPATEVAVAVRDPHKAEVLAERGVQVRHGDYDQPDTLTSAFTGAERLLFISSPELDSAKRMNQHRAVVAAARAAQVGVVVYTSGLGADLVDETFPVLGDHHATEKLLIDSTVPYTILRHPLYSDMFINADLQAAIDAGELTSSTGGRGMNTARRADLAEAAATVLCTPGHAVCSYNLTGQLWTYPQLAEMLTALAGRPITYREIDHDEGIIAALMIGPIIRAGGFETQTPDLQSLLQRPPSTLQDTVEAALATTRT